MANQDTDNLSVFNFNQCSGEIKFTGNEYRVPSPNFVCCCPLHDNDEGGNFSSEVSDVSDTISENGSTILTTTDNKIKLQDDLSKALAEVERLRTQISLMSS